MKKENRDKFEKAILEGIYCASDPVKWKERRENRIDRLARVCRHGTSLARSASDLADSFERRTVSACFEEHESDPLQTPEGGVYVNGKEYIPLNPEKRIGLVRQTIIHKTYHGGESLLDMERDITEAIEESEGLPTEDGILQGSFTVSVVWQKDY